MRKILFTTIAVLSAAAGLRAGEPMSVRMALSEMERWPTAAHLDFMEGRLKWNYTTGFELDAILDVDDRYGYPRMQEYALEWYDEMIDEKGNITTYKTGNYNLDHIRPGGPLFRLYDRTGDVKFRRALRLLREQLTAQPRTSGGGFWHKQIYPHQMWLDGLFMASPWYAEYSSRWERGDERAASMADIARQFVVVAEHTFDPATGLYRHAWDESRSMFWADPATGQSAHAWGRALGWYVMALVDALDWLPKNTPGRGEMVEILQGIYRELPRWADPETGMWYQVLDRPEREGNYVEATASAMFSYALLKGIRQGNLDASLTPWAVETYENLVKTFIREDPDGTVSLEKCCAVAGLGGKEMRSGTFEYYISEPVRDNDPKGVGAFIRASLEYEALGNIDFDPRAGEVRPLAFPGAEGGGKHATGGRGGRVIYVTSLADDGSEGTFRHAVLQEGPRTVLFAVDGTIFLEDRIVIEKEHGDLTIAGQSAPGDGVCIAGNFVTVEADNVIIRYLRFRMGDTTGVEGDAFNGKGGDGVIIDHCSVSWSTDECASFYAMRNFTMQWCIISEALNSSVHKKGDHGYGAIWGGRNATFHHNLFAHNNSRNPRLDHPAIYTPARQLTHRGTVDFVNNVVYNWGNTASYGGERGWWNFENNLFKAGPASKNPHRQFTEVSVSPTTSMTPGRYYIAGNVLDGAPEINADNWKGVRLDGDFTRADVDNGERFPVFVDLPREDAAAACERVLAGAGASHRRDEVDGRVIREVRTGTATYTGSVSGREGIIDSQNDVGGWPVLRSGKFSKDTDGDGMPDRWEKRHKLNPFDPFDGILPAPDENYTNLETYLNGIVE